ncbi:MAG TPA: DUF1800 domain-containing protein [Steroidobacteraceae bacterium]|nr:DUF1800 domain-containing protein [Steroidobacteraceae bacterium]
MKPAGLVAGLTAMLALAVLAREPANPFDVKLAHDRQAMHVLNRAAFGPRPGDLEAVRRLGVKAWLKQQLDPAAVPENPELQTSLSRLVTLDMPTWQLYETTQPQQQSMMSMVTAAVVPGDVMTRVMNAPLEDRRKVLDALTPEVRAQALASIPQQYIEAIPELRAEADRARQQRQEMLSRQQTEQQRRLRPPLNELFSPDELNMLRHGTDQEKTALIASLGEEKRAQVFRSLGPQGAQLLPAAYRRQAVLVANPQQGVIDELVEAKLQRALHSNRQLEEVLVDFWFNHFNVSITKPQLRTMVTSYERDAIRPHVLGRFRDLLLATARHPAMLFYLDNYQSQAPRPELLQAISAAGSALRLPGINENYARELMELHTLGVDGGYTQEDVVNVARAFSGWSIYDFSRIAEFQFNPANHDRNEKVILGQVFPRGVGEAEGVRVIDLLARHPSTARFISRKLAQRFVADEPPAALVERMAATFTRTDGDLRAVMETLLLSKEFLSEGAWRAKVKSPLEMVVGSLRAVNADVSDATAVAQRIADLGQPLYAKAEPTGYPNTGESWTNSVALLGRMNFAAALFEDKIAGVKADPRAIAGGDMRRAMLALTGVAASPEAIAAVEKGSAGQAATPALMATVMIGSPDFQRR